jgi:hypothetical protein
LAHGRQKERGEITSPGASSRRHDASSGLGAETLGVATRTGDVDPDEAGNLVLATVVEDPSIPRIEVTVSQSLAQYWRPRPNPWRVPSSSGSANEQIRGVNHDRKQRRAP